MKNALGADGLERAEETDEEEQARSRTSRQEQQEEDSMVASNKMLMKLEGGSK